MPSPRPTFSGPERAITGVPWRYICAVGAIAPVALAVLGCGTTDLAVIERLPVETEPPRGGNGPTEPPSASPAFSSEPRSQPEPEPDPAPEGTADMPPPAPALEPEPTPAPVVEPSLPEPMDAGSPCDGIVPLNLYRLRVQATDLCLLSGAARPIGGIDAFDTALGDCDSTDAVFQIVASTLGSFEIRNVPTDFNLDVEMGVVELGTPLVLFPAHDLQNQKFILDELDDGTVRIQPRLGVMANLCVQATPTGGVALAQCVVGDSSAKWTIEAEDCGP
jgi:hypothetical protein